MAGPKPRQTEVGICQILESCGGLRLSFRAIGTAICTINDLLSFDL